MNKKVVCIVSIKTLEKTEKKIKFLLDADIGFANALRRVMMNEVPVLAVETVIFEDNNSGLFDEVVAHRLGLIPLKFDIRTMNMKKDCKCDGKGCSRCQVRLVLEKSGLCTVMSSDIVSDIEVEKNIPIVELLEGQHIKLEAIAELGLGIDHTKYQSAIVGYSEEKTGFRFSVESVCGLSVQEILEQSLEIIEERCNEFEKEFKKAVK